MKIHYKIRQEIDSPAGFSNYFLLIKYPLAKDSPAADKIILPPGTQTSFYHPSMAGRCIDYRTRSGYDSHMAIYYNDIPRLQTGKTGNLLIFTHASPTGRRQITLPYSCLIQAPVYKSRTVKGIWTLCPPYIRASYLRPGHRNQPADTGTVIDHSATATGRGTASS